MCDELAISCPSHRSAAISESALRGADEIWLAFSNARRAAVAKLMAPLWEPAFRTLFKRIHIASSIHP